MSPEPVIGVDAGGTKLLAGALAGDAEVHHRVFRLWGGGDRDQVLATMVEAVGEVRAAAGDARAVGFGIPSLVEFETGTSVSSVHLPLDGVPFRELMTERLGLPVHVDNDVNLALLGEVRVGRRTRSAARGDAHARYRRRRRADARRPPLPGANGAAGELGHVTIDLDGPPCQGNCPNRGCLEVMASGPAIGREGERLAATDPTSALGRALAQGVPITGEFVTDLALRGDRDACAALRAVGERLGAGLVGIVNAFNPEVVVIGGGAARGGNLLLDPARRIVQERALPPSRDTATIALARLGDDAGLVGAAIFAREGGRP